MYSNPKSGKGSIDNIWLSSAAMNEICKCCRKSLGLFSGNIALFRGKCMSCRQKVCNDCVSNSLCHKCRVKKIITLNPKDLMKLPSKRLIEISSTLHFHNPQGYEKSELVQLILAIYGCKWKRPIPDQPGIPDDEVAPANIQTECVLCENEPTFKHLVFCQRCTTMLNQPQFLMNLPGRQLHCILKLLQIPEQEMKGREKGDLVTLVLSRIGNETIWKPPLPQQPSTSNPQHTAASMPEKEAAGINSLVVNLQEVSDTSQSNEENHQTLNDEAAVSTTIDADSQIPTFAHIEHVRDIINESDIQQLKSHQLKSVLRSLGEETEGICERKDLLDRVTELWILWKANENEPPRIPVVEITSSNIAEAQNNEDSSRVTKTDVVFARDVPKLKSINNEEAIRSLTVRQLKMILQKYSVNYAGCRERSELADKVVTLWKEDKKWDIKGEDLTDEETCKICMDAPIDCVLLECGHMVACTECGRQMSECPICREFVVRVVHTFRV